MIFTCSLLIMMKGALVLYAVHECVSFGEKCVDGLVVGGSLAVRILAQHLPSLSLLVYVSRDAG